jgi:hypothetical protein
MESVPVEVVPPLKLAETLCAEFTVTVQVVAVPLHAPPQPVKVAPAPGVADSVTLAPASSLALHVPPVEVQLIPPPVTVPAPVTLTESEKTDEVPLENAAHATVSGGTDDGEPDA